MNATNQFECPVLESAGERVHPLIGCYRQVPSGSMAEEDLVRECLPLVKSLVARIAISLPPHIESQDLYSAGLVGLLSAVRQYNAQAGSTFESYARVRIRGAIFDELRRQDWAPRSVHEKSRKVQAVIAELEQEHGRIPTIEEVAKTLGLSVSQYQELLDQIRPATFVSLDSARAGDDNDMAMHEELLDASQEVPSDLAARNDLHALIADRIKSLPEIQQKVLALYYIEDLRLREIAQVFGVTESRICQIHSQALLNIRSFVDHLEPATH